VSSADLTEPFTAYAFRVELRLPGRRAPLCDAAFAACDGLEMRFDVTSVADGGSLGRQRLFSAPAAPGHVTLRRGMTSSFDLWDWCTAVARDRGPRADCLVVILAADGRAERARFRLRGCLPVRLRGPALDAVTGGVAVEELELACESIALEPADSAELAQAVPARVEIRELDEGFGHEINERRWVRAELNPATLDIGYANEEPHGGAGTASLTVDLLLDATADGRPRRSAPDVQRLAQAFAYFVTPRPVRGAEQLRAPAARLVWGDFTFDGYVDGLRQTFDLFSAAAKPARAWLRISMTRPWIGEPSGRHR
jgi:phage tail-like protein